MADVTYYIRGGGTRTFTGFDTNAQTYAFQQYDQTQLTRTGPASYQMLWPDGSKLLFNQSDGSLGTARNVFLTQVVDPFGNAVTLTYDGSLRLIAITDAIGQVTTLTYGNTNDIYKITEVTDPFGRSASFTYDALDRLTNITDVIGLTSQFTYETNGDFINSLITPYGTNTFIRGDNGNTRALDTVYADGSRDRVEFNQSTSIPASEPPSTVPTGMATQNGLMVFRNTFYWSRTACATSYGDYTKARIYHWLHAVDETFASGILESTKEPLENRVWNDYAGQIAANVVGTSDRPSHIGRVLDDGSTQLYTCAYDGFGHLTNSVDPVGRTLSFVYDTNSPSGVFLANRTLEIGGTAICTNAEIITLTAALITNCAGALFEAQSAIELTPAFASSARFDNAGTFRIVSSTGTTIFESGVPLNNYGTVDLKSGTLLCNDSFLNNGTVSLSAGATAELAAGGSASGTFMAAAAALVNWVGGTFTLNPGAQFNGSGNYRITSGTTTFNTDVPIQNLDLAGTLNGTGAATVNGLMNWIGDMMSGSGLTVIAPGAALNVTNAGTMLLTSRTLENAGTVLWANLSTLGVSGAVITNRAGALFDAQNAAAVLYEGGAATRFDNAGTFRKSLNTGSTTIDNGVDFNNYGTVDIQAGFVVANGGYTSGHGALLNCALGGTNSGSGYGQLQVAGAVTLNGALSVGLTHG